MISLKRQWKIFAEDYIKHGNAAEAYKKAYPKANGGTCYANGSRLLKRVEVSDYIAAYESKVLKPAMQKAINRASDKLADDFTAEIFSVERKKAILKNIAEGKEVRKIYKMEFDPQTNKSIPVIVGFESPSTGDRIKAIEVHNRMTGEDTLNINHTGQLTFLDFIEKSDTDDNQ